MYVGFFFLSSSHFSHNFVSMENNMTIVSFEFFGIHQWSRNDYLPLINELISAIEFTKKKHVTDHFVLENAIVFEDRVVLIFECPIDNYVTSFMAYLDYTDPTEYDLDTIPIDQYDRYLHRFGEIYHRHVFC